MSALEAACDRDANVCVKCEAPFRGLQVDLCPSCRGGRLEFVNLGRGLFGADSPKLGHGRRYVVFKSPDAGGAWHVNVGLSPVCRGDRPKPFGGLHEAKEWCRWFEDGLGQEEDDDEAG